MTSTRDGGAQAVRFRVWIVVVLAVSALVGTGYFVFTPWVVRYRLTVEVDVDGRPVSGSSVIETRWRNNFHFASRPWDATWIGEAVSIDLGERGLLFVLLSGDPTRQQSEPDPLHLLCETFVGRSVGGTTADDLRWIATNLDRNARQINPAHLPMMVRFRDIHDPMTVERIDPNELSASFGSGVRIESASLRVTDEPVTTGIAMHLPWLQDYYDLRLDGQRFGTIEATNKVANSLSSGAFKARR